MRRMFILGLDSAPPKTIYDHYGVETPNLNEVTAESERYLMRTSHPPITIPAWMSMFTGKTPGELGIYGFRHRKPGDVGHSYIVNYNHIKHPTLWDTVGSMGGRVGVFGVPPTYPPRPVKGFMVTDFMTPSSKSQYTFPPWLKRELEAKYGPLIFDIVYRSEDKAGVRRDLFQMTRQHIEIVKYLIERKQWDLFIYVEIGIDRLHHAFWKYFDQSHPRYTEHQEHSKTIPEYYKLVDQAVGEIRRRLPPDTVFVVVSDHGIKPMTGAFAVNQWLIQQDYLRLKQQPKHPATDLTKDMIDWENTLAWAWGGYYSRIFINLKGREPNGIVDREEYEDLRNQLARDIARIKGPQGQQWINTALKPEDIYPEVNGDPPDLLAYFDNLNWRAAGTIGHPTPYLKENDRGPDDAVHDWHGVLAIYDPEGTLDKGMKGEKPIEKIKNHLQKIITG